MALPYENATSGQRAIGDVEKLLRKFGCSKFATGSDFETGEVFVQFEHHGRPVMLTASARGYAAAWLREHPHTYRTKRTKAAHEARALEIGNVAVYSMLRDWVKGQVTAVEVGMLSFEAAFLAHLVLPAGDRVIERLESEGILQLGEPVRDALADARPRE